MELVSSIKYYVLSINNAKPFKIFLLLTICYLILNCIFVAKNTWAASYKLVKIIEFIFLGMIVIKLKPRLRTVLFFLSIGVIYSSLIAILEFIFQKSIGGILWWLGERTFYAGTPGIALTYIRGRLFLRPYTIFPHPNVFGGYLSIILPLIFYLLATFKNKKKDFLFLFFFVSFVFGLWGLILSFSKAAWTVAVFGFTLVILVKSREKKILRLIKIFYKKNLFLIAFYLLFLFSLVFPLILAKTGVVGQTSVLERASLIQGAMKSISSYPLFGLGLNNSIIKQWLFLPTISELYVFQPVHNIFLLIWSELGLVGFLIFVTFLSIALIKSQKQTMVTIAIVSLMVLGFFDHYLFTLQQGQLLFTLLVSLGMYKRYNEKQI